MEQVNQFRANHGAEKVRLEEIQPSKGKLHACKASQRGYQLACDRLKRAERDLAETAAFIAASLTTVTAIQAVISIAKDKLELSKEVLQFAFQGYIAIFILIFLLGALRIRGAIHRRTQAERDIDQTKKGIFEFCDPPQWPKPEE
jgi:cytochrome c biogenesis protein CcdA